MLAKCWFFFRLVSLSYERWMWGKEVGDCFVPTSHLFVSKWWHRRCSRSYLTGLWPVPYSSPHMLGFWVGTVYCLRCRTELHHSGLWQWHGRRWLQTQLSRRSQQIDSHICSPPRSMSLDPKLAERERDVLERLWINRQNRTWRELTIDIINRLYLFKAKYSDSSPQQF